MYSFIETKFVIASDGCNEIGAESSYESIKENLIGTTFGARAVEIIDILHIEFAWHMKFSFWMETSSCVREVSSILVQFVVAFMQSLMIRVKFPDKDCTDNV